MLCLFRCLVGLRCLLTALDVALTEDDLARMGSKSEPAKRVVGARYREAQRAV